MEEQKESVLNNYPNIISYDCSKKIIEQMERNICKINIGEEQGTGFFCKIPFPSQDKIIVDNEVYEAKMYDSFGSHNRKRISIMNIPYQINEIPEEELESNSIQICELKQNSFKKVVGIYNILPLNVYYNSNNFFDNYYDTFGDIYDKIIKEKKGGK